MTTMQTNQTVPTSTNSVPVEEFINKAEVARRLKKTVRCVDNWMSRGILPYYKIGRSVAFKWSEIEAALARTCRVCRG
jgi:predicted DNA-binding transcriptional regulator AlpA